MRILVFGDSIGYGEYDSRGGWVNRFYLEYLNRQANDLQGDHPFIFNLCIGGDTIQGVLKRFQTEVEARNWEGESFAFVFAIGINDTVTFPGTKDVSSPEQYKQDLEQLYQKAKKFSDKMLFVGLTAVVDGSFTHKLYSNERISQFNAVLEEFAQSKNCPFVPLQELFQKRMAAGEDLFVDGLHPNDAGHDVIYEHVKPKLNTLDGV